MDEISVAHIQEDFLECLSEVRAGKLSKEQFFINVDLNLNEIEEYIITVKGVTSDFEVDGEGNDFVSLGKGLFCATLAGKKYNFLVPLAQTEEIEVSFTTIDAALHPNFQYVVGDRDGGVSLYDGDLKQIKRLENAHNGEITVSKYFPSGEVILTASSDMKLKIWSVKDGITVKELTGHKGRITGVAMIERGRNFVSSSLDGTIKLWECGSGKTIKNFARKENRSDGVNDVVLIAKHIENQDCDVKCSNLEFGVENKLIVAAHVSGVITIHDILKDTMLQQLPSRYMVPCNSISSWTSANGSTTLLYAGYDNGLIALWNLDNPADPVETISINEGLSINKLKVLHNNELLVSSSNDTCIKFILDKETGLIANKHSPIFIVARDNQIGDFTETRQQSTKNAFAVCGSRGQLSTYLSDMQ